MINLPDIKNITPEEGKDGLVHELVAQIRKDFSEFNYEIEFSGNIQCAYEEMFTQIDRIVRIILHDNYQRLLSLLYRIDISEKDIKEASEKYPQAELDSIITEVIIKRELQKVVVRRHFS